MNQNKVKIRLYSDLKDISTITSAINKIDPFSIQLIVTDSKDRVIDPRDLAVMQINSLQSNLLTKIIDIKSSFRNKVIFVVPDGKALIVSTLVRLGFTDIFVFPFEIFKFTSHLKDLVEKYKIKQQNEFIGSSFQPAFFGVEKASGEFKKVYEAARRVAKNPSLNILILGETGTGKGLLAKTIHQFATGNNTPFVDVLCTAIPENLLESELFGHEKGAFTNAQTRKLGLFELAENGTIFLDEIGDLSYNLQSKLLRAIEKKLIRRLGGLYDIPINTRIISATNKNLLELVEHNRFRSDLFYRLNGVSIELPPLRERGMDVIMLTKHFISIFNKQFSKSIKRLDKDVEEFLLSYNWPGNIRELRNAIERAVLLGGGANLKLKYFSKAFEPKPQDFVLENYRKEPVINLKLNYNKTDLRKLNKLYTLEILTQMDGNKSITCQILGISRPKLDRILK